MLPIAKDFFQKEKDRWYPISSPFSLFFNTLSDRLVSKSSAFFHLTQDVAFWLHDTMSHPENHINEAQSLQPKGLPGLQHPCLRLTHGITDLSPRLGTGCVGSTLSWWLFQPPALPGSKLYALLPFFPILNFKVLRIVFAFLELLLLTMMIASDLFLP